MEKRSEKYNLRETKLWLALKTKEENDATKSAGSP
jgi:hypothetical protein